LGRGQIKVRQINTDLDIGLTGRFWWGLIGVDGSLLASLVSCGLLVQLWAVSIVLMSMGRETRTFTFTWKFVDDGEKRCPWMGVEPNLLRVSEHVGSFGSLIREKCWPVLIGCSREAPAKRGRG
jgi:hypothetical protein